MRRVCWVFFIALSNEKLSLPYQSLLEDREDKISREEDRQAGQKGR